MSEKGASKPTGPAVEAPWERNRRLRQAALEAAQAHGEQLAERYGYGATRPRFAEVKHLRAKSRRRR